MLHTMLAYLAELGQNPMFSGIVAASVLGGAMWALREVPASIGKFILNALSREVSIQNDNIGFEWAERWLSEHKYMQSMFLRKMRLTVRPSETVENDDYEKVVAPGVGYHFFFHRGRPLIVHRWQDDKGGPNMLSNKRVEGLEFRMFFGSRARLLSVIDEAQEIAKFIPGRIPLFIWTHGWWNKAPALRPRPLNTVYLPEDGVNSVIEDAMGFARSREWYAQLGIPYRRGYLFKGVPGTGKTTLAIAMASALRRPVYVIPLAGVENDTELAMAIISVPRDAVLLFEDIDTVNASADRDAEEQGKTVRVGEGENSVEVKEPPRPKPGVTLGGLLNGIDGVFASEGRILVMTTNHPEKLDAAMTRAGRVDYTVEFDLADCDVMAQMFNSFFRDKGYEFGPSHFEEVAPQSPATVQNILLKFRDDPDKAKDALLTIAEMQAEDTEEAA